MQGSDHRRRPDSPRLSILTTALDRVRESTPIFLLGVALAVTFQVVYQLLRTVIALPRAQAPSWPRVRVPQRHRPVVAIPVEAPPATAPPAALAETRPIHTGAFAAFHYPPFVIYFCGLMFGVTGYFMFITAQGWLALQLTNSAAGVSVLFTISTLPMIVLTLFGGAFADRVSRRWLVCITRLMTAALLAVMGLLAVSGQLTIPSFIAVALVLGVVWSFDLPTRQALVGDLVPAPALSNAYAWQSVLQFTASTVGPIAAGQIVLAADLHPHDPVAVVADDLGSRRGHRLGKQRRGEANGGRLVLALTLVMVKSHQVPSQGKESIVRRVGGGLGFIARDRSVLLLMIFATLAPLTIWGIMPLLPIVARDVLGGDAATYGLLTGAIGVGSIAGAAFIATAHRLRSKGWLALWGSFLAGGAILLMSYTQSLEVALFFLLLNGATSGVAATLQQALVQVLTPREYQGRVASVYTMTWNVQPIAVIVFGFVAESAGVPTAIWLAGAALMVSTIVLGAMGGTLRRLKA